MAPEALTDRRGARGIAAALAVIAVALSLAPQDAYAVRAKHSAHRAAEPAPRQVPYPTLDLPLEISGSQYSPLAWADIAGRSDDDHLAAYKTFRASCRPIGAQTGALEPKALGASLSEPCQSVSSKSQMISFMIRRFTARSPGWL